MKIVKREPGVGYFDTWLWMPKSHVSDAQIRSAFTFVGRNEEVVTSWKEEPHHYRVPRNYLSSLSDLPFPVFDTRFTAFPRVVFKSTAQLDTKEVGQVYQREGSEALLGVHDGVLCLRCGAGKTVVGIHTAAQLNTPILIVVTDKGLARQWMEEIETWLGIPQKEIGRVGGDSQRFDWEHPITVALVQTLASRVSEGTLPVEMTHHFGVVLCDEAHLMGAPYFNTGIPPFAGRRWGLSATPVREDGFDTLLRCTMGQVVYTYLQPALKPVVYFRRLHTKLDFSDKKVKAATHDVSGAFHFGKTFGHFASRADRTAEIVREVQNALGLGRQILVLTHSRDMCDTLSSHFPTAGVCHGDVKEEDRIRRIKTCNPVIAIMQLGKQALNKPSLDTLFVCEPFTKKGALQQTMGRVLRIFSGKKKPLVVFFEDVNINPLHKMCGKLRVLLNRWPEHKGGQIMFKVVD